MTDIMNDLVERARAAQHDERLSDGALYGALADEIEALQAMVRIEDGANVALRSEIERLRAALAQVRSYNVDIHAGRINYRPLDHIAVIDFALKLQTPECAKPLKQIRQVCADNAGEASNHKMALDFVHQIAIRALKEKS